MAMIFDTDPDRSCERSNTYGEYPSRALADRIGTRGEPQAHAAHLVRLAFKPNIHHVVHARIEKNPQGRETSPP
jgi:hypothetical protein